MLWVGWYGFNAGSAIAADGIAANAFMATTLAAAVACTTWPAIEWWTRGKPTVLGFCSGAVAGLVVITPAAGFVTASGAVLIGILAGSIPYLACMKLKAMLGYDDALDTFGVHGVGGTLGALLTGFLATPEANPNLTTNLGGIVGKTLWVEQLKAMGTHARPFPHRHIRHRFRGEGLDRSAPRSRHRRGRLGSGRTRRGGLSPRGNASHWRLLTAAWELWARVRDAGARPAHEASGDKS